MSNYFTLKLAGSRGQTIGFLYDDENQCRRNYDEVKSRLPGMSFEEDRGLDPAPRSNYFEVIDGVGNVATIDCSGVAWVWMTNLAKELEGQKGVGLLQAHAQANLQRTAQADPLLRQAPPGGIPDLTQLRRN